MRSVSVRCLEDPSHLTSLFYSELLLPSFGMFPDELEPVEVFQHAIKSSAHDCGYLLNIILLFDDSNGEEELVAGCSFELYPRSRCGLLTYIAVLPSRTRQGLARILIAECMSTLKQAADNKLQALFLETNSDAVDIDVDVMSPSVRRGVLNRLGFEVLDVAYIQPALAIGKEKARDLLLAVHRDYCDASGRIESQIVLEWLKEFFIVLMGEQEAAIDKDLRDIVRNFESARYICTSPAGVVRL
eukprot:Partr_v1_DN28849_c1_g1_i2_m34176